MIQKLAQLNLLTLLPKMTAAFTTLFQGAALIAQAIDVTVLPEPWRSRAITIVGLIQMLQAMMAHNYAPNGQKLTPGAPPYVPPPAPPPVPGPPVPPNVPPNVPPPTFTGGLGHD